MTMREQFARRSDATPRPRRLDGEPVRITAHFWVTDRLYEVDYERTVRPDGRTGLIRVQGSERRCRCPGRDDAEQERREHGAWQAAGSCAAGATAPSMGAGRR